MVPAKVSEQQVDKLFTLSQTVDQVQLTVDLKNQQLLVEGQEPIAFEIEADVRDMLLKNLDCIGVTEEFNDKISAFEATLENDRPWQ